MTLHVSYKYICDICGDECAQQDVFSIPAGAVVPRPQEARRLGFGHCCERCYQMALRAILDGRFNEPVP